VQFYEKEDALLDRLAEFTGSALGGGHVSIVVATPGHRSGLLERLRQRGMNTEAMIDAGRFILLDAADTLRLFMVDGQPDHERFSLVIGGLLSGAASAVVDSGARLAVFGEMVALLWAEGRREAALRLEELWNELGGKLSFSLLCAYPIGGFGDEEDRVAFQRVCGEHSHVTPCESYDTLSGEAARLLTICELQQKAQMLQVELDRRKRAEVALRKSEEFTRSILESSVDCIKVADMDGRLLYISPPGLRVLGISDAASVLGHRWTGFWNAADQPRAAAALDAAKKGEPARFEGCLYTESAATWWDVTIAPMSNEHGVIDRLLIISRENTEMKRAQAALMQSEKLAAAGRLAATVAHEINNPLEAVTNFIYLAKTTDGLPESVHAYLDVADQELARVGHIAQQTLGFYRDTSNPGTFKLAGLIEGVVALYGRRMQYKNIEVEQRLDGDLSIFGRKGDIKQVLSNLLTNAIDATGEHGRIVLRTRPAMDWQSGQRGIRITVADSGTGMSAETQAKAFSAFFTTKADVGTGIGLWVTKNILERWGGAIRCRSVQGQVSGTVMSVFLPLEPREPCAAALTN
jgi:PAS domain S-box-containing protein